MRSRLAGAAVGLLLLTSAGRTGGSEDPGDGSGGDAGGSRDAADGDAGTTVATDSGFAGSGGTGGAGGDAGCMAIDGGTPSLGDLEDAGDPLPAPVAYGIDQRPTSTTCKPLPRPTDSTGSGFPPSLPTPAAFGRTTCASRLRA